jgi:hypothetical protein
MKEVNVMADALVGYSGFVGSTLLRQRPFDALFRSTNIGEMAGQAFKTVYCAGAPAQKWLANKNPSEDLANIESLIQCLDRVQADEFVLISTVDVFASPVSVSEETVPNMQGLHAYGRHRLMLEDYVKSRKSRNLIVRLPGLVGPGLKKNIIYDYAHGNQVEQIDCRGVFQFYPLVNLAADLQTARKLDLGLVHLTAEPICVKELIEAAFGVTPTAQGAGAPVKYDVQSCYAQQFGGTGRYQYAARDSVLATRAYVQGEMMQRHARFEVPR